MIFLAEFVSHRRESGFDSGLLDQAGLFPISLTGCWQSGARQSGDGEQIFMSLGVLSGKVAVVSALTAFAAVATAAAQGTPLRDNQYTEYLQKNDFNGEAVATACEAAEWPVIAFRSSADEKNLDPFLDFLQVRPSEVKGFNNGQFSQTVSAFGEAIKDICANTKFEKTEAELMFAPPTNFDPLIDGVNLSYFQFDYAFQHHQPAGHLPLERRSFPVLELEVEYDSENYPGRNGDLWSYQTAEMIVTVNNYKHFRAPESGDPGVIRQEYGSYPCYYVDPKFNGVYRYAFEDCNPKTLEAGLPKRATNLSDAVYRATINFIEQNIDTAPEPVKVEDYLDEEVCCLTVDGVYEMTKVDQCGVDENEVYMVQPVRICGADGEGDPFSPFEDDAENGDIDPGSKSSDNVCCQDVSGINPNIFNWKDRRWCEDQDNHRIVSDRLCPGR